MEYRRPGDGGEVVVGAVEKSMNDVRWLWTDSKGLTDDSLQSFNQLIARPEHYAH